MLYFNRSFGIWVLKGFQSFFGGLTGYCVMGFCPLQEGQGFKVKGVLSSGFQCFRLSQYWVAGTRKVYVRLKEQ